MFNIIYLDCIYLNLLIKLLLIRMLKFSNKFERCGQRSQIGIIIGLNLNLHQKMNILSYTNGGGRMTTLILDQVWMIGLDQIMV